MKFFNFGLAVRSSAILSTTLAIIGITDTANAATVISEAPRFSGDGDFTKNVAVSAPNSNLFWRGTTAAGSATANPVLAIFNKFDGSLGTLTGATLMWSTSVSFSRSWTDITCDDAGVFDKSCEQIELSSGASSASYNIEISRDLMASGSTSLTNVARLSLGQTGIGRFSPDDDEVNLPSELIDITRSGSLSGSISGFDLAALTGTGARGDTFQIGTRNIINFGETVINCDASGATRDTCKANLALNLNAFSARNFRMVYTYEEPVVEPPVGAVPLPAGMPLLLAGLGGLVALRRRR